MNRSMSEHEHTSCLHMHGWLSQSCCLRRVHWDQNIPRHAITSKCNEHITYSLAHGWLYQGLVLAMGTMVCIRAAYPKGYLLEGMHRLKKGEQLHGRKRNKPYPRLIGILSTVDTEMIREILI